jgi:hypothetical protein
MAHRIWLDANGMSWDVWDTIPRSFVRGTLQEGWLTFESTGEKRRLAPVPLYWVNASDDELAEMFGRARRVPKIRVEGGDEENAE